MYYKKSLMVQYSVLLDSAVWTCEPNLVSCSMIRRYLQENDHILTNDASQADFIIISSCGVMQAFEDRCLNLFAKYHKMKKDKAVIILYGCLTKTNIELVNSLEVYPISNDETSKFDTFFYNKVKFSTIKPSCNDEAKNELLNGREPLNYAKKVHFIFVNMILPFSKRVRKNYETMFSNISYKNRNFVIIGKGCAGNCSYCVIKKAKGKVRSRTIKEIFPDIESIYDPSKNLFLVADDCGCYGLDIKTNIIDLVNRIHHQFPDIIMDLNYLNPQWIEKNAEGFKKLFRDVKIEFVLIPMQSGSKKILKSMNRHYDIKKVICIVNHIKQSSPNTFLYTHFIVGFPGEGIVDFFKSISVARHFDYPVPFKYTEGKGTKSETLPNKKSKFTISLRYMIFILCSNFIILMKLLKSSKNSQNSKI